ncbi:hypothetical protein KL932_000427 [Ogataea haglerorum]|nr:hypothetical protein KL932_000427 [Ogataea haglerorum]
MPTRPVPAPSSSIGSSSFGKLTSRRASMSDDPHVFSPRLSLVSAGSCRQIGGSPSTVIFRVKPGAAVRPEFSEMIVEASAHTSSRSAASIHESGHPQMPVRYDTISFVGSAARSEKLAYSSGQWVRSHASAAAKLAGCSRLTVSMDRVCGLCPKLQMSSDLSRYRTVLRTQAGGRAPICGRSMTCSAGRCDFSSGTSWRTGSVSTYCLGDKKSRGEQIPLWLATLLKKQEKCNIVVPEWLSVEYLRVRYDEEIKYPSKFSNLPWHWLPIAKKLLDYASDDFIDPPHEIRSLLQDLREVRLVKARKGIRELNHVYIQLDGLSLMEINEIRPFILEVMDQLRKMNDSLKVKSEDETPRQAAAQMDRDDDSDDDIYQKK